MPEIISEITNIIQNLSSKEVVAIIGVTAFLLLFLVYRKLGLGAAVALVVVYLIAYVIYSNQLISFYESQDAEKESRMKEIEEELSR